MQKNWVQKSKKRRTHGGLGESQSLAAAHLAGLQHAQLIGAPRRAAAVAVHLSFAYERHLICIPASQTHLHASDASFAYNRPHPPFLGVPQEINQVTTEAFIESW